MELCAFLRNMLCAAKQDSCAGHNHSSVRFRGTNSNIEGPPMSTRCQLLIRTALLSSCAVLLAGGFGSAQAQLAAQPSAAGAGAPSGGLEEIVVTAERRSTNIQATALSISAIKADV